MDCSASRRQALKVGGPGWQARSHSLAESRRRPNLRVLLLLLRLPLRLLLAHCEWVDAVAPEPSDSLLTPAERSRVKNRRKCDERRLAGGEGRAAEEKRGRRARRRRH